MGVREREARYYVSVDVTLMSGGRFQSQLPKVTARRDRRFRILEWRLVEIVASAVDVLFGHHLAGTCPGPRIRKMAARSTIELGSELLVPHEGARR